MQVLLENIAFNHDPDLTKTGSFFLRRNETQVVPIPEWNNQCSSDPACAPAGYAISELPATLTIKASFSCDNPAVTSIHIQALENPAGSRHILGTVQARPISLQNGRTGLITFQLPNARTRITNTGVSVSNIAWQWQFSTNGQDWTDLQTTTHRIYTVLEMPKRPWQPTSNQVTEIHVPWTEVLDRACMWAADTKDIDAAAAGVTCKMYELGQKKLVRYLDGGACYAHDKFDCTKFLQLLTQGAGNGQTVNCSDCATVVSTFSNVLGAELSQSSMGVHINTHPILLIGSGPNDWNSTTFGVHEVAWKNNGGANDPLFDACLQVDGDGQPQAGHPQHTALQPTNLVFHTGKPNSYRFCLFATGQCMPIPFSNRRRRFGPSPYGFPKITNEAFLNDLKKHYEFDTWKDLLDLNEPSFTTSSLFDLPALGNAFEGWDKLTVRQFSEENFPNIIEVLLKRRGSSQEFVQITVYQAGPAEKPTEFLLQLLGQFEVLNFKRLGEPLVGNVSFVAPTGVAVLFKRRIFVATVRSVGIKETWVIEMAAALDLHLRNFNPFDFSSETRRNEMQNNPRFETLEATPQHPLGDIWHSFVLLIGAFFPDGDMDLRTMKADGSITDGKLLRTGETLVGQADLVVSPLGGAKFALHLETNPRTAIYNGLVVFESGLNMTLVGGFRFLTVDRPKLIDAPFEAQNEGVWIITKP